MAISAQFAGYCAACESRIEVGDAIESNDEGKWVHVECVPKELTYTPVSDTSPLCPDCFMHHRGECL